MLTVRFDSREINRKLGNAVKYSYGFLEGIDMEQIVFNQKLGEYTITALNKYIDSRAKMNPQALHHVYEWNMVGDPSSRLFEIDARATKNVIHFMGKFLPSKSISDNSHEPFENKAEVMENSIDVVIEPHFSDVLAFEVAGEPVFTTNAIHIANPGGDAVAGSFGRVVEDFFSDYFTNALLKPFVETLSKADEFARYFEAGTLGGKNVGVRSGAQYIKSAGIGIE